MATETSSDLTGGTYYVCEQCKEGKYCGDITTDEFKQPAIQDWLNHHASHGDVAMLIATTFLSKHVADGYIDIDRPDLEPLVLHIPGGDDHDNKAGIQPGGAAAGVLIQRMMQRKTEIDKIKQDIAKPPGEFILDRPTFEARQPSIKDMQVTLPWTVKYSSDFRSNPESHKDFRHAITHVMKAGGKLCAIVDDYDHRRTSTEDHRVKDYLADLVICAMRAANTHPGGVIDLMQAVQDRVTNKNFTNVKVIEDEAPE